MKLVQNMSRICSGGKLGVKLVRKLGRFFLGGKLVKKSWKVITLGGDSLTEMSSEFADFTNGEPPIFGTEQKKLKSRVK